MRSRRPVVGIVAGRHQVPRPWGMLPVQGITEPYPDLLAAAGAVPVSLPVVPADVLPPPGTHAVRTAPGSLVRELVGEATDMNSIHHQAVARLGRGLRATAWGDDDVVEAVELPGSAVLGVQWHPELQPGAAQKALFDWLVRSAGP